MIKNTMCLKPFQGTHGEILRREALVVSVALLLAEVLHVAPTVAAWLHCCMCLYGSIVDHLLLGSCFSTLCSTVLMCSILTRFMLRKPTINCFTAVVVTYLPGVH